MKLTKTSYFINVDSSDAGCGGLIGKRLAVLADFHDRDYPPVLDLLKNDIPDAILIPGDVVLGYFPPQDPDEAQMGGVKSRHLLKNGVKEGNAGNRCYRRGAAQAAKAENPIGKKVEKLVGAGSLRLNRSATSAYVIDRCPNIIPFLEGCCEIAPTYMSIGNHECLLCSDEYDMLRATGIVLLDNEWTELRFRNDLISGEPAGSAADKAFIGGEPATCSAEEPETAFDADSAERILVGGLTSAFAISYRRFRDDYNRKNSEAGYVRYPYRKKPRSISNFPTESAWLDDFERAEGYKILLCHHPEYWCLREPMIKDRRFDLVLSGHAHGGQWRIMGRGIFAPWQGLLPKYTEGVHQGRYGRMIISRGLSNPYKIIPRLGNPCEAIYLQFVAE